MMVCVVDQQIIADRMSKSWAFAHANGVSTDDLGRSHLDMQIRYPSLDNGNDFFLVPLAGNTFIRGVAQSTIYV